MRDLTAKGNKTATVKPRRVIEVQIFVDWPATQIDMAIILNHNINPTAKDLYNKIAALVRDGKKICVSIDTLASLLGRSPATTRNYLKVLTENGIIESERCKLPNGSNAWEIVLHDCIRDNLTSEKGYCYD